MNYCLPVQMCSDKFAGTTLPTYPQLNLGVPLRDAGNSRHFKARTCYSLKWLSKLYRSHEIDSTNGELWPALLMLLIFTIVVYNRFATSQLVQSGMKTIIYSHLLVLTNRWKIIN